jgi:ribosomal protein S18 acetylase RimI-like enzyme
VPFRRRGYAGAVFRRLVDWARRHGAAQVYLQVEDDNEAALALYRPHGGERVYGYWYREEQPGEG